MQRNILSLPLIGNVMQRRNILTEIEEIVGIHSGGMNALEHARLCG